MKEKNFRHRKWSADQLADRAVVAVGAGVDHERDQLKRLASHVYFTFPKRQRGANSRKESANFHTTNMIMNLGTMTVSF